jgi:hypothetical protein
MTLTTHVFMPFSPETLVACLSCGVFNIKDFSGALIASKLYLLAFAIFYICAM